MFLALLVASPNIANSNDSQITVAGWTPNEIIEEIIKEEYKSIFRQIYVSSQQYPHNLSCDDLSKLSKKTLCKIKHLADFIHNYANSAIKFSGWGTGLLQIELINNQGEIGAIGFGLVSGKGVLSKVRSAWSIKREINRKLPMLTILGCAIPQENLQSSFIMESILGTVRSPYGNEIPTCEIQE